MKLTLRSRFLGALISFVAAAWFGPPAYSQYIFLDVNGDAACTSADVLTSGTTAVDVYLDTNHNADGSIRTCTTSPTQPLDMFGFDLVLHQSGSGSIIFTSFTSALDGFTPIEPLTSVGGDVGVGYTAPIGGNLAPGRYKLGTFNVTVTGSPALSFVGLSSNPAIPSFGTGFGTLCDASDFANTIVLGTDFNDNCGTGGGAASDIAPVLSQPSDMTVSQGETADQTLTATDANGDPLDFVLVGGPPSTTVTTLSAGTGTATGNLHLDFTTSPFRGQTSATIRVTDRQLSDTKTIQITVLVGANPVNRPPVLAPVSNMTVDVNATADQALSATDPDGDPLTFSLASGPGFATVTTQGPGSGNLHLAPGPSDVGSYLPAIRVSDGRAFVDRTFTVFVNPVVHLSQPADMTVAAGGTADQTLNATDADGDPLVFFLPSAPAFVTVTTVSAGTGTATGNLHVAPSLSDAGVFSITVWVSDGFQPPDSRSLRITVTGAGGGGGPNDPPTIDMICNSVNVVEGGTLDFDVVARDTDADAITLALTGPAFMTLEPGQQSGTVLHANLHVAPPLGAAGTYHASVTANANGQSVTEDFTATVTTAVATSDPPIVPPPTYGATVTLTGENKTIRLASHSKSWTAELEPEAAAFAIADVIPGSLTATYEGTKIRAIAAGRVTKDDSKLAGSFAREDLRTLFSGLPDGTRTVDLLLRGDLASGGSFLATASVPVEKGLRSPGRASPNPFNPSTTISFELKTPGRVRLRIYDVAGHLVNSLLDRALGAGLQEARWDGTATNGSRLSSGVYFFVLETPEGTTKEGVALAR